MTEREMNNVRKRLAQTREYCFGMPQEIYAITDYMSTIAEDSLSPEGLARCLFVAMDDIKKQRNGFSPSGMAISRYLRENKRQALNYIPYIPQVIDEITESEFAEAFRAICKEDYGFNPPKRAYVQLDETYPKYVRVGVDWWADAILCSNFNNKKNIINPLILHKDAGNKQYSKEEMRLFKTTLADEIVKCMQAYYNCNIDVEYLPCNLLAIAGEKIGISPLMGYPWKTWMRISTDRVEVSNVEGCKTLWTCS